MATTGQIFDVVLGLVGNRTLREAAAAMTYLETEHARAKVVLTVD